MRQRNDKSKIRSQSTPCPRTQRSNQTSPVYPSLPRLQRPSQRRKGFAHNAMCPQPSLTRSGTRDPHHSNPDQLDSEHISPRTLIERRTRPNLWSNPQRLPSNTANIHHTIYTWFYSLLHRRMTKWKIYLCNVALKRRIKSANKMLFYWNYPTF